MADVVITIKTIDQSTAPTKKAVGSFTELSSAIGLARQAMELGKQVYTETIDKTIQYAGRVRDLTIATKGHAEESSRLIQVLDDYEIQQADITAGMKALKEKGLTPTIDTIADLSEQFLAIEDPAKRLQFAQDNLGRSSAKFLNVLSQGPDKIRELNDAVSENLILTDRQVEQTERYRLKIDEVQDKIEGYKISATLAFFDVADAQERARKTLLAYGNTTNEVNEIMTYNKARIMEIGDEYLRAEEYGRAWAKVLEDEVTPAIEEDAEAVAELSKANQDYLTQIGNVSDRLANYEEQQAGITKEQAALKAEIDSLIAQGWSPLSDKVLEVQEKYDELGAKSDQLATQQEKDSRRMVLAMLEQELAIGGLSAKETDYLIQKGIEWGIYSETAIQEIREARAEVAQLTGELNGIPTSINVKINVTGALPGFNPQAAQGGYGYQGSQYASGGSFVIPQAYGYEGFNMGGMATASGGETVTVTPKNKGSSEGFDYKRFERAMTRALSRVGG